jgi:serine/threonine protein kinase
MVETAAVQLAPRSFITTVVEGPAEPGTSVDMKIVPEWKENLKRYTPESILVALRSSQLSPELKASLLPTVCEGLPLFQKIEKAVDENTSLGRGAFSDVYDIGDGRCVKLLPLPVDESHDAYVRGEVTTPIDSVAREVLIHLHLSREVSCGVIPIHCAGRIQLKGKPYVAIEMDICRPVSFNDDEMSDVVIKCQNAKQVLAAFHSAGVIHHDIKSDNLYQDAQGNIVFGDFGCASLRSSVEGSQGANRGTISHQCPVAVRGVYSAKSDFWALGCALHEVMNEEPLIYELNPRFREGGLANPLSIARFIGDKGLGALHGYLAELSQRDPEMGRLFSEIFSEYIH